MFAVHTSMKQTYHISDRITHRMPVCELRFVIDPRDQMAQFGVSAEPDHPRCGLYSAREQYLPDRSGKDKHSSIHVDGVLSKARAWSRPWQRHRTPFIRTSLSESVKTAQTQLQITKCRTPLCHQLTAKKDELSATIQEHTRPLSKHITKP